MKVKESDKIKRGQVYLNMEVTKMLIFVSCMG